MCVCTRTKLPSFVACVLLCSVCFRGEGKPELSGSWPVGQHPWKAETHKFPGRFLLLFSEEPCFRIKREGEGEEEKRGESSAYAS
ncbi:hypothetical protein KP509_25G050500 [Ceratopteris richardii]|uniref:Secreted protein n=1 Tax=Ceratopteris richardii TaxID=49495 RepID=A0A8T2RR16_CERRI|nr:hypothetical protein KP509_25G050500 [Ceratopteris richardii]